MTLSTLADFTVCAPTPRDDEPPGAGPSFGTALSRAFVENLEFAKPVAEADRCSFDLVGIVRALHDVQEFVAIVDARTRQVVAVVTGTP